MENFPIVRTHTHTHAHANRAIVCVDCPGFVCYFCVKEGHRPANLSLVNYSAPHSKIYLSIYSRRNQSINGKSKKIRQRLPFIWRGAFSKPAAMSKTTCYCLIGGGRDAKEKLAKLAVFCAFTKIVRSKKYFSKILRKVF